MTLSSTILSEDDTSEMLTKCVIRTFKEGRSILTDWREITKRGYPGRQDLLDTIPGPFQLSIANISKGGWIMTRPLYLRPQIVAFNFGAVPQLRPRGPLRVYSL